MTYENAVAKMAAAEVGEDAEVSTVLQDHPPLIPTRSDASFHSLQYSQYTSEGKWYQLHTTIKRPIINLYPCPPPAQVSVTNWREICI